jgi:hypothetical protein
LSRNDLAHNEEPQPDERTASADELLIARDVTSRRRCSRPPRRRGPRRRGIVFQQDIEDMFYSARQFAVRDLNGYLLYFIQSTPQVSRT